MTEVRNFVIIAHIDHGKSTLADRFLELTGTVERRKMREQYLDMHPLERERGITIKMQPVRMNYKCRMPNAESNAESNSSEFSIYNSEFILNLIDTPGHADFSYEVSRALAAVEGAILLVDATQGVQAQTLANIYLAQKEGLAIIPAVNKIDLPSAETEKAVEEICDLLGCKPEDVHRISAKDGTGVADLLRAAAEKIPPPRGEFKSLNGQKFKDDVPLRALIFDSKYDPYLGVIAHARIVDGELRKGDRIRCMATGTSAEALEVGVFSPERTPIEALRAGEIGYVATGIKEPVKIRVGDTITSADRRGPDKSRTNAESESQTSADLTRSRTDAENENGQRKSAFIESPRESALGALPGYREATPVVFASIFPENQDDFETLRDALEKLRLEDAALTFSPEDAGTLGRGFRAGFLGLLHMEIIAERLRREYDLALALSRPSVAFQVKTTSNQLPVTIYAASRLPPAHEIAEIREPWARIEIVTPARYLGALTALVTGSQGTIMQAETLAGDRLLIQCEAPLREIIVDFYDKLKSISQGFASFSYGLSGDRRGDLVRLDIVIAGELVPSLSEVVPRSRAYEIGRGRVAALKEILPRALFTIALQASIEGRIIARETIAALKKDVTGYLYGGDRTRKMKLWKKQQRGKKRLKEAARVVIPPEVFFKLHRQSSNQ